MEGSKIALRLRKSLCGTVTAPKFFCEHIQAGIISEGFRQSLSDPCLFIHDKHQVMVLQHVDDQIWISKEPKHIDRHITSLQNKGFLMTMEDNEDMFGFLGINIKRKGNQVELMQKGLIEKTRGHLSLTQTRKKPQPPMTHWVLTRTASPSTRNGITAPQWECSCTCHRTHVQTFSLRSTNAPTSLTCQNICMDKL